MLACEASYYFKILMDCSAGGAIRIYMRRNMFHFC